ncbi:MAG: UDP-N-acetylmuramate--alanine ligase [Parcubacteria group bacterium Gr01-1014_29]|nr:MAG: UDP-N-acetylmuramate--alanine ligase [Parcubacteria group bacterium Gr01-1014_29]
MVGITGQGMVALCELLVAEGKQITGSDTGEVFQTSAILQKLGIRVKKFQKKNITKTVDAVVRSSAYGDAHVEIAAARHLGIPVMDYIDAVAEIFNTKRGVLIAGTHGKTSTTALVGCMLEDAGYDPTVLVGATVRRWGKNARAGKSEWMVAEGDEYQNKFLKLRPEILIITNIEYDHPDFFTTKKQYEQAFRTLVSGLPPRGLLIAEKNLKQIIVSVPCPVVWYGIVGKPEGRHMELNKKAALLVARRFGIARVKAKRSFDAYEGVSRRIELYTSSDADTVVLDDYAHHPTEIKTTLAYIRRLYPKHRITALFQPHTYSRTHVLLQDFTRSFGNADEVVLMPIYSSARERKDDFPPDLFERLLQETSKKHSNVKDVSGIKEAVAYCRNLVPIANGRVIVTFGAGDVWQVAKALATD